MKTTNESFGHCFVGRLLFGHKSRDNRLKYSVRLTPGMHSYSDDNNYLLWKPIEIRKPFKLLNT